MATPAQQLSPYSSTNVSAETDIIAFYNELSSLVPNIPKHNVFVIGGDMNAQIGKNVNLKFSLHDSSNRNGQHLTDSTLENRLTCLNTKFQKRKNCQAYSSFEGVSYDHRIVTVKKRLGLRRNTARTITTVYSDRALLNNSDIRIRYTTGEVGNTYSE